MLLAIDTATQSMSLALHDGRKLLGEQSWFHSENPTAELAPAVRALLKRCDVTVNQLSALAVSIGPGLFSDLRVGVAFAKGMAAGRGLPLVGVTTLDTIAAGQPHYQGSLIVVVGAGHGRIVVGRYQWKKGRWGARGGPQMMDWNTLFSSIDGAAYLSGDIDDEGQEALTDAQAKDLSVSLIPPAYRMRRAGFLAEEAWTRLNADKTAPFPASDLQPLVIKPPESSTS